METLTLKAKEQKRLMVLNQLETKKLTVGEASRLVNLSERQVWRLLAAYREEGVAGLVHGNRGRKPVNSLGEDLKRKVVELAAAKYAGFNHTHFTEKLAEEEQLPLSRSSVRRILLGEGIHSPRRRRPSKHRSRRPRYPCEGMLLQTDGSEHDWLEGRGSRLCLIGAIDDATGKVPFAFFQDQEDSLGYMRMLQGIVLSQGIPLALYHDRHSIFDISEDKLPSIEEQLKGKEPLTQIGRLLKELGIESISANSPQAKGRVERLWGTFQDRLCSELRAAKVKTMAEANEMLTAYLPRFNRQFAVQAVESELAYRPLPKGFKPEEYFCFKYQHTVGHDNVVRHDKQRLQILPSGHRLSYALCKVEVQERLDGSLAVYYQGQCLNIQSAPAEATLLRHLHPIPVALQLSKPSLTRMPVKPAADHPWRGKFRVHID
jgi:transposase